jgi:hypothetical protein
MLSLATAILKNDIQCKQEVMDIYEEIIAQVQGLAFSPKEKTDFMKEVLMHWRDSKLENFKNESIEFLEVWIKRVEANSSENDDTKFEINKYHQTIEKIKDDQFTDIFLLSGLK